MHFCCSFGTLPSAGPRATIHGVHRVPLLGLIILDTNTCPMRSSFIDGLRPLHFVQFSIGRISFRNFGYKEVAAFMKDSFVIASVIN